MDKEISNQELFEALKALELRMGDKIVAIEETLIEVVDNMVTKKDLKQLEARTNSRFDDLELRLGRRIDQAFTVKYEH